MRTNPAPSIATPGDGELTLHGLGVSVGIAIGPAHLIESGWEPVPEYTIADEEVEVQQGRLTDAVGRARTQLTRLKAKSTKLPSAAAEEIGFLLDAHLAILSGSRLIRGADRRITEERVNAEWAIQAELSALAQQFAAMDDAYLAGRIQDIRDVGARLIRHLADHKFRAFSALPSNSVIIAEEITPADTAVMDPRRIIGFACTVGGVQGHTAIMARALGIPAVLGISGLMRRIKAGQTVIVDGAAGRVIVNPSAETTAYYERCRAELATERTQLRTLISLPSRTQDGMDVNLQVNIELPREIASAMDIGAAGIGLLRSEFLFMNRDDLPDEEEQYLELRGIVESMEGRPVTLRTLDVGGEKLASALGPNVTESPNPALGLRAIRLSLRQPKLLEQQLAAMLRAGAHGPVRILLPMISSIAEVRQVRSVMLRVARRLRRRGQAFAWPLPPLGVMIEVPGAALAADALAQVSDFFALGTNDLIQYTLAIDRGDEQVAGLYDPLHPAVLRLIQFTSSAAERARIPISVCGEMAGEPQFTALLVGLGIRELSMSPTGFLRVKRRVRSIDTLAARRQAAIIMEESDPKRIAALLDDFNDADWGTS